MSKPANGPPLNMPSYPSPSSIPGVSRSTTSFQVLRVFYIFIIIYFKKNEQVFLYYKNLYYIKCCFFPSFVKPFDTIIDFLIINVSKLLRCQFTSLMHTFFAKILIIDIEGVKFAMIDYRYEDSKISKYLNNMNEDSLMCDQERHDRKDPPFRVTS